VEKSLEYLAGRGIARVVFGSLLGGAVWGCVVVCTLLVVCFFQFRLVAMLCTCFLFSVVTSTSPLT
jgi:hypothetical protein